MQFVAVDAGGTSSRAVVVDERGRCLGAGRAASGNPTSAGADAAAEAVAAAVGQALHSPGADPAAVETVLVAHAGGHPDYRAGIERRLAALGVTAPMARAGDVAALFASGTPEPDGAALIAGTGAIGGAIRGGHIVRTVDGTGWLLGDGGSGFWIGHRVARAVVDDLDGGPATALTPALLDALALPEDRGRGAAGEGRPRALGALVAALYAERPVALARFAPLAFGLAGEDPVAGAIVREAVGLLAALLVRLRAVQPDGPLVFGGSVLVQGVLGQDATVLAPLLDAAGGRTPIPVQDGLVGAAVLALRERGVEVDAPRFALLTAEVRRAAGPPA